MNNGPTYWQGCLLVLAGMAMVFFGCLGAWSAGLGGRPSSLGSSLAVLVFFAGFLVGVGGLVVFVMTMVRAAHENAQPAQPPHVRVPTAEEIAEHRRQAAEKDRSRATEPDAEPPPRARS